MNRVLSRLLFTAMILMAFLFSSCNGFEGDQTVPSYIHIDTIMLTTDYATQGSSTAYFSDAWVYINDNLQGVYELPATFPVLKKGVQSIRIHAGIKLNGMGDTRADNVFWSAYEDDAFELFEDSVVTINPTVQYYEQTKFPWMEDFESASVSLEPDTVIGKTTRDSDEALLADNRHYSGVIHLDCSTNDSSFYMTTPKFTDFTGSGNYVLLEMDYKCSSEFTVGLYGYGTACGTVELPLVTMYPTKGKWKKIYVNLGPNITDNDDCDWFKVFFGGSIDSSETTADFYFDNLKVVTRQVNAYTK